jgi:hypothetical protein
VRSDRKGTMNGGYFLFPTTAIKVNASPPPAAQTSFWAGVAEDRRRRAVDRGA